MNAVTIEQLAKDQVISLDEYRRMHALDRAVANRQTNYHDADRSDEVLAAAKKFESFLKGGAE